MTLMHVINMTSNCPLTSPRGVLPAAHTIDVPVVTSANQNMTWTKQTNAVPMVMTIAVVVVVAIGIAVATEIAVVIGIVVATETVVTETVVTEIVVVMEIAVTTAALTTTVGRFIHILRM